MTEVLLQAGPVLTRPDGKPVWVRFVEITKSMGLLQPKQIRHVFGRNCRFAVGQLNAGETLADTKEGKADLQLLRGRERRAEEARLDMIKRPKYYRLLKTAVKRLKKDPWPEQIERRAFIKQRKRERAAA